MSRFSHHSVLHNVLCILCGVFCKRKHLLRPVFCASCDTLPAQALPAQITANFSEKTNIDCGKIIFPRLLWKTNTRAEQTDGLKAKMERKSLLLASNALERRRHPAAVV